MSGFYKNADQVDQIDKDPDDVLPYAINWYDFLRGNDVYWTRKTFLRPGTTATPSPGALNAHRYRYSGGITGTSEPTWPTGTGGTVADGNGTWTEIGAEDTVSTKAYTVPTGITKDSEAVDATNRVTTVTLSGGTAGTPYTIACRVVSANGVTHDQSFIVNVTAN